MSRKEPGNEHPMRQAEDSALNAYREWPVLLVLRQKELQSHLAPAEVLPVKSPGQTDQQSDAKRKE